MTIGIKEAVLIHESVIFRLLEDATAGLHRPLDQVIHLELGCRR